MNTPLSDAGTAKQKALSAWRLPDKSWCVFTSGLWINPEGGIDFVQWRLITLRTQKQ